MCACVLGWAGPRRTLETRFVRDELEAASATSGHDDGRVRGGRDGGGGVAHACVRVGRGRGEVGLHVVRKVGDGGKLQGMHLYEMMKCCTVWDLNPRVRIHYDLNVAP